MKKQTKKRVKKPTQLDRIEADQKLILSKLATLNAYEKMVDAMTEAKESVAKGSEPWKPKIGDYFVPTHRASGWPGWNCEMESLIGSVRRVEGFQPEDRGGVKTIGCDKWDWDIRCVRPATPEEKERAEAQKLAKLKFGVKVRTWNGEGVYWYSSYIGKDEHRVVFHDSAVLVLKLSDITIIE